MANKKLIILGVLLIAVVIVALVAFKKPSEDVQQEQPGQIPGQVYDPTSGELIPGAAPGFPTSPAAPVLPQIEMAQKGVYDAECIIPGQGMVMGIAQIDAVINPYSLSSVDIKNANNGSVTKVDMKAATCTFTAAKNQTN